MSAPPPLPPPSHAVPVNSFRSVPVSFFWRPCFLTVLVATAFRGAFHVRHVFKVTPRKAGLSTCGRGTFSSFSVTFSFTIESAKSVACVLLQLISMHHASGQELTLLMASCITCVAVEVCSAEVQSVRPSTCTEFVTLGGSRLGALRMSFTYRRNRFYEGTLPCGTPSLSFISLLSDPSSFTLAVLW